MITSHDRSRQYNRTAYLPALLTLAFTLLLSFCAVAAWAQSEVTFPALTDRVTDQAKLLDSAQKAQLIAQLEAHESATSNQIVVVTVNSLQGLDIADYSLKLGRKWGIGTAEKDNGVLLVVAPKERKVRIEVGRGLEGALPDGLAGTIVRSNILPSFRESDYPRGISNGVTAIEQAIKGEYTPPPNAQKGKGGSSSPLDKLIPLFFVGFVALAEGLKRFANRRIANAAFPAGFTGLIITVMTSNFFIGALASIGIFCLIYFTHTGGGGGPDGRRGGYMGNSGGFGGSGGGFSGGGGGFGGGGASGSW